MNTLVLFPNLGAEDERPLAAVDAALAGRLASTWASLFGAAARLDEDTLHPLPGWLASDRRAAFPFLDAARGLLPWLSTEAAEERARALGIAYAACPSAVTARVSDKAWALEVARELRLLPPSLATTLTAFSREELGAPDARALVEARLASWPARARESFTLKPRFGSSGRGRVKGRGGHLDDAGAAGLPRLARRGGAVLEPWLARTEDLSAQVFVPDDGAPVLLGTTRQLTSPSGVWLGNVASLDERGRLSSSSVHDEELRSAALSVALRAADEGFRGPLGVDAFAYRDDDGAPAFRAVVEVNARFTMGLVTLGLARKAERGGRLSAGQVCAFLPRSALPSAATDEARADVDVTRLSLPAGALVIGAAYEALPELLSSALPARGKPKRR